MEDVVDASDDADAPSDILDSRASGAAAVRGSAMRSIGYVAGLGLGLLAAPLVTRHLGVVDFGRFTAVLSLGVIVTGLTEGGVNAIAVREFSARNPADRAATMRDLLGVRITLSLAGAVLAIVVALLLGWPEVMVAGTAVVAVGLMLQALQALLSAPLQTSMRFGWVTMLELTRNVVLVATMLVLVVAGAGLSPFFAVFAAGASAALVLTVPLVRGEFRLRPSWHLERWWPLLRATFPFAVAIAVSVVYFRVGVLAMTLLDSDVETGLYAGAFRVVEVLIGVPPLIAGVAFPIVSRAYATGDRDRLIYASGRLAETLVVLGVAMSVGLVLGAEPVMLVVGGDAFAGSAPVLRIQGLGLIATCAAVAAGFVLLATHRSKAILLANAVALVASVVLCAALIPLLHAQGAALAIVCAESMLAVVQFTALGRALPELRPSLLQRPLIVIACGAAASAVALVPGLPALVDVALGMALFGVLLTITGRLPGELRELVTRR